ncbi:MAG: DUF1508 domain-containing protein [Candidatus Bathyarchaeia archaeon]|jgi:uncharacterized protein YegP (UPF0339 family)/menaquinone-dependent protoporphyrinogen IX oxidase
MTRNTLIAYSTKTGINAQAAYAISEVLKTTYKMDVTIADLQNGPPDITPFQNIIVGGGVKSTNVYDEAVDFLAKNFEGKSVALYFCCEDAENPKAQSTADNTKKVLAKNESLKPIDVTAFGGCMIKQGKAVMDDLNMNRIKDWAKELGEKFVAREPIPPVKVVPVVPPVKVMPVVEKTAKAKETEGVFEIILDSVNKFRFHLKAANGEIIAVSQSYVAKESAITGIDSIKKNAPIAKIVDLSTADGVLTHAAGIDQDPIFEIQFNAPDRYRFHLKAANGEIIAVSQSYLSKQAAETGISSVKKNAPMAKVVDCTTAAT